MIDPSKRPTKRMKRVQPNVSPDEIVVKIEPTPKRAPRGSVREEVVADDSDPRRERG